MFYNRSETVVYLNVYNVTGLNKGLEWVGLGLYHTSLQIFDLEFSFGGHEEECSGIVVVDVGNQAGLELKESLAIGVTHMGYDEIDEVVEQFGEFWHGIDYDPFARNCNDFTRAMAEHICANNDIYWPSYI